MNLEEANFILNQLTISEPCINGYMYIGTEEVDQAIELINKELKERKLKIAKLEKEIEHLKNRREYKNKKENLTVVNNSILRNEVLSFNGNINGLVTI